MAFAVIALVVSTLTSMGIVALWAATSQQRVLVRAAAPLAAIAPLLAVPAYEPFVALSIEAVAVAVCVGLWRRAAARRAASPTASRLRFSLASLLAAMTVASVAVALYVRRKDLHDGWQSVGVIGLGGAAAVLLGAWTTTFRGFKAWLAPVFASALSVGLSAVAARADWFAPSFIYRGIGWPPSEENLHMAGFLSGGPDLKLWMWYAILPSVALLTLAIVRLGRAVSRTWRRSATHVAWTDRAVAGLLAALVVAVATPAAVVLYKMTLPDAIPVVTLPKPNAFGDLMAAGKVVGDAPIDKGVNFCNCDPYNFARSKNVGALAKVAPALESAHAALKLPYLLPIDYVAETPVPDGFFGYVHCLGQAFVAEARVAELNGDQDRALDGYLDVIRLGYVCRRGGLLAHARAGATLVSRGMFSIMWTRDRLTREQCLRAVDRVEPWEADVEPFATFAHRDYLRQLYGGGWHGRLDAILRAASDPESIERYQQGYTLERTKVALFKSHLWLRAYMTEHDALPVSWEQITDSGLPPLPADPWTAAGQPLRYRTTAKGYVLYSVGPDGVDNGGAKPASATFAGLRRGGDYHIDLFGRD